MESDNPSGADNQQERPCSSNWLDRIQSDLGNWVAGFVDGEGSFNVPIRRERDADFHGASRCRSMSRRSVKRLHSFFVRSSAQERFEAVVTVSSTLKSPGRLI